MFRPWQRIGMAGSLALLVCTVPVWVVLLTLNPSAPAQDAATMPSRDAQKKNPIPSDNGSRITGAAVYTSNCLTCHGSTGKGDGPSAHLLDTAPANLTDAKFAKDSDGTLFWKIGNGHPPMPRFENNLSEESRWNLVNYLRTLITAPASPSSTVPSTGPSTEPPREN